MVVSSPEHFLRPGSPLDSDFSGRGQPKLRDPRDFMNIRNSLFAFCLVTLLISGCEKSAPPNNTQSATQQQSPASGQTPAPDANSAMNQQTPPQSTPAPDTSSCACTTPANRCAGRNFRAHYSGTGAGFENRHSWPGIYRFVGQGHHRRWSRSDSQRAPTFAALLPRLRSKELSRDRATWRLC